MIRIVGEENFFEKKFSSPTPQLSRNYPKKEKNNA
jgi:hypothetical protein